MEEQCQPCQTERTQSVEIKVAILEDRLQRTQADLTRLEATLEKHMSSINSALEDIKNRPNSVTQFVEENWKALVLVILTILGANATLVENISRILAGS